VTLRSFHGLFFFASVVFALSACKSETPGAPGSPIDQRVVLAPGGTTAVPGATVRFEGVTNDSRCPGDAICVWGGDAIVRVVVGSSGSASAYELHTASINLQSVQHGDLRIALETLSPYPFASLGPIKAGDYRATLRITR
jgi:hypothetical protein